MFDGAKIALKVTCPVVNGNQLQFEVPLTEVMPMQWFIGLEFHRNVTVPGVFVVVATIVNFEFFATKLPPPESPMDTEILENGVNTKLFGLSEEFA